MTMDIVSVLGPPAAVFFGAGGIGFVFGYAVKKVAKIFAVIVGLFFMGLAYMDYNGWVKVNWQAVSNSTNAAATSGMHQVITIVNHTAIQVQISKYENVREGEIVNVGRNRKNVRCVCVCKNSRRRNGLRYL